MVNQRFIPNLHRLAATVLLALAGSACNSSDPAPDDTQNLLPVVEKSNSMKLYMHYMPWFQTPDVSGYWGSHWTMTNKNPDVIEANGQRQIASHYYPLVGPYDSRDPDVLEYHLLLMKYAGIDGVLIDWYGTHQVYDYKVNHLATEALVKKSGEVGMQFAMVYEDYTAQVVASKTSITGIQAAQEDMQVLDDDFFTNPYHIEINNKPLLLTFGPRYFRDGAEWTEVFSKITKPTFLPLWGHGYYAGAEGAGEFAWVDFKPALPELTSFYNKTSEGILMGSAYPRFHDFYAEGGTGTSYGYVDFNDGATLQNTLAKAKQGNASYLQLVTWNDFGEGTVIEPTMEDGFRCLEIIQQFAGVAYTRAELELIHTYYLRKKTYKGNATAETTLEQVLVHLANLDVAKARDLLATLD